ncbi:LysR family transcriptional regulator [Desulfobotulus sp. H1]|uniref:LysR family transcriptional regulator n=1 Tax=Desulfobotulus pelophilus TaxID=2823377 RepID=A0ABT3N7H5_9BACT|nr:LysR family transcriptional regulator [Desulfobotulus pelophilus]MCW7753417.1 LysR family transcriptional regulator [Desulfobotulus pelophilus]
MYNLEIKHLRMICALAESENMTRAAEKLFITQSALSQQLKDIETKLGTDLFFRTRKKMIITEGGRQLQKTAVEVLDAVERAERDISRKTRGEKGELKVGTQCIFCYKWLPQVLKLFHARFPHIEIEIGNSVELLEELEEKKFDLVISGAVSSTEIHTAVPLFEDQLVCVIPEDHPLAACRFLHLSDFGGVSLIAHADRARNRFYQQILKPAGVEPGRIMNVGAPQAILEMVMAGFGMAVLPRWAVAEILPVWPVTARPITRKGLPLTWHAVYLTRSNIPVYQQEFIRSISRLKVTEEGGAVVPPFF